MLQSPLLEQWSREGCILYIHLQRTFHHHIYKLSHFMATWTIFFVSICCIICVHCVSCSKLHWPGFGAAVVAMSGTSKNLNTFQDSSNSRRSCFEIKVWAEEISRRRRHKQCTLGESLWGKVRFSCSWVRSYKPNVITTASWVKVNLTTKVILWKFLVWKWF